ncbi:MAG: tandem-95 repeat protein [Aureliella sp.]
MHKRNASLFSLFTRLLRSQEPSRNGRASRRLWSLETLEERRVMAGDVTGNVFNDLNANGLDDTGDKGLAGWTVFLDTNSDGALSAGEPSTVTDTKGRYALLGVPAGTQMIYEVLQPGFAPTPGFSDHQSVTVRDGKESRIKFPNVTAPVTTGQVAGTVFLDGNQNGLHDIGEEPLQAWTVFVDSNGDGSLTAGEPVTATDADGNYRLADIPAGTVSVVEVTHNGIGPVVDGLFPTNGASTSRNVTVVAGATSTADFANSILPIGNIQGTVWNDANGDGLHDAGESPLAAATVYIDLNTDGVQDATEPVRSTDASGAYAFTGIRAGSYRVASVVPAGWITAENHPSSIDASVAIGSSVSANFFDLVPTTGSVSGVLWNDLDGNGIRAAGEDPLAGWQVYVDVNANGVLDAGESSATTGAGGEYTLSNVAYGTTTIREVVQAGFTPTNHPGGSFQTLLLNGENRAGIDFGNHEPNDYSISGMVFNDANKNGLRDAGEAGLSGITLYLDSNHNGALDAGEPTAISSADLFYTPAVNEQGQYSFTHLARGTYTLGEIVPDALSGTPASASTLVVSVGPASKVDADLANRYRANEIHGVVFDDTNANHVRDPQEYARPGVPVYIDLNRDNVFEADEPHAITGADGSYAFLDLSPGAYIVREDNSGIGEHSYPTTGGGILWPEGVSHPAVGNVTPSNITASLADGEVYTQTVSLTLPDAGGLTNLVDVFLLFDDTGSFASNSPIVRSAFPSIISSLQSSLPGIDLGFGVGRFEEYANFAAEYATGRPFILNQPIVASSTPDFSTSIQAALDRMAPGYGGDAPETDIEALYQLVTGAGFDGNNNGSTLDSGPAGLATTQLSPGTSGDVPSFASFTADPASGVLPASGNVGGGGFRAGALPIVLLATDVGFAYQPKGETAITGVGGLSLPLSSLTQSSRASTPMSAGAGIQETVTGLNALGALVIGLGTNAEATLDPRQGLESLSKLTGAVNRSASTIANGTVDPIAPGDPMYFQISSGFATSVSDGIVSAVQNAVTNVAMDITIRASDPRVKIINHSGTKLGVAAGQTASFDIEFVGDGRPHRFDLEFVREGTNVVLGSIPVVLGTPVAGEGYEYDELFDGEIHQSSHFGNYVANVAPSFIAGSDQSVLEDAGTQAVASWASQISAGPATESAQSVEFIVTNDNPALFSTQPTIAADGTLTFAPAPNANGTALVTVSLRDNGGVGLSGNDTSPTQTFRINVAAVNDAPVAADDSYSIDSTAPLAIAAAGILANDSDADGDALTPTVTTGPAHGTLTLSADGSFLYTPDAAFRGVDSFAYQLSDGTSNSNVATVSINVQHTNQAPVASDDSYAVDEDTTLSSGPLGVVSNDVDSDGDVLSAELLSGPTHGTLALNLDGSFTYTPALNYNGIDTFTYRVTDGTVFSNVATVTIAVAAINDAPVAANDAYAATEDQPLSVSLAGILSNDADAESSSLAVSSFSNPSHGTLSLNADGSFTYTPDANFNGIDSFTYSVSDGSLDSNLATVTLSIAAVNDAPVAAGDSFSTAEDTPLGAGVTGVLLNDTDVDGNTLQAVRVSGPAHGSLTLSANGTFAYTPAANFNGIDTFTYVANDGLVSSNVATVTIAIAAVNDAPVALGESYSVAQDAALSVPARGVLANASDVDGDALSAILGAGPAHGSLVLNADGSFTYTPAAGYSGSDSFTYRASDALAFSGLATVVITVTPHVAATKFFVVDADLASTYQYAADGSSLTNRALDKADTKPQGIASNSSGTTQWVIDAGGTVFVYDNQGTLLGQWQARNIGKPEGITVWGNDLWLVDSSQDRVFKFAGGASLRSGRADATSSFALSGANLDAKDLVTDGTHLWVVNDTAASDQVFRYSTSGVLEGSWTISASNPSPSGITLDPVNVNHLWIVDASTDRVYQYNAATSRLSGSQEPDAVFALAAGNTNPQGIADPLPAPTPTAALAPIVQATEYIDRHGIDRHSIDRHSIDRHSIDRLMADIEDHSQRKQPGDSHRDRRWDDASADAMISGMMHISDDTQAIDHAFDDRIDSDGWSHSKGTGRSRRLH